EAAGPGGLEEIARALVERGEWTPEGGEGGGVRLDVVLSLPHAEVLAGALGRAPQAGEPPEQFVRRARLLLRAGEVERAAAAFRTSLKGGEGPSPELVAELAEAAGSAGDRAVVRALGSWLAERTGRSEGEASADAAAPLLRCARAALACGLAAAALPLARAAEEAARACAEEALALEALEVVARAQRAAGDRAGAEASARALRGRAQSTGASALAVRGVRLLAELAAERGAGIEAERFCEAAAKDALVADDVEAALAALCARARLAEVAGRHERARAFLEESARRLSKRPGLALALREALAELDLRLGRPDRVLALGDKLRQGYEHVGDAPGATRAVLAQAEALALAGDAERAERALARAKQGEEDWALAGRALGVRAHVAEGEGRLGAARGVWLEAARALRAGGDSERTAAALLRRAELAADEGDFEGAGADLEWRAALLSEGASPCVREELLRALLCADPDEGELLLEEARGRAETAGTLSERCRAAEVWARRLLEQGDADGARVALTPVLQELRSVREGLPEPLREGFRRSPLIRGLLALAQRVGG
ncbi:MAG: hypothetical protein D6731_22355, partial [Planctomycetota bacterium]